VAAINSMSLDRILLFQSLANKTLKFGSDCSGADSAFHAARTWVPGIAENEMMSEDPTAEGPILFGLLNGAPARYFKDLLARSFSGFCIIAGKHIPIPMDLDYYSAGTVCTDFSVCNSANPKEFLGDPFPCVFEFVRPIPFQSIINLRVFRHSSPTPT
jgi:hypothetical protein